MRHKKDNIPAIVELAHDGVVATMVVVLGGLAVVGAGFAIASITALFFSIPAAIALLLVSTLTPAVAFTAWNVVVASYLMGVLYMVFK